MSAEQAQAPAAAEQQVEQTADAAGGGAAANLPPVGAQHRARTVSMAQRLARQPLSEGYDLWDRGYTLGAMRLFTFKTENAPPFQVGAILDAMGHLLMNLQENNDAKENFNYAAEKYDLIQQPILAAIMRAKAVEAEHGIEAALAAIEAVVEQYDGQRISYTEGALNHKTKPPFGRLFHYRAYLLWGADRVDEAIASVKHALELGYDRVHLSMTLLGDLESEKENDAGARAAYEAAIAKNANMINAYLPLALLQKKAGQAAEARQTLNAAIELHPRASFIRHKAYILSETGHIAEALEYLDQCIANPPHEEGEAVFSTSSTSVAEFQKAKAAVLADAGRYAEAKAAAEAALALNSGDEEATSMIAAINDAMTQQE